MLTPLYDFRKKIDNSFPKGLFLIKGFCEPFRIDRNIHGGGILFYVREDIPVKLFLLNLYQQNVSLLK